MSIKPTNIPKCHLRKSADSAGNISRHCKLGELTENIRTFAPPFENQTYTFSMYFEYDSWNRIKSMTYPDGEVVSYDYNLGGMLEQVTGDKGSEHNVYVHHIEYNPFEQKETVVYGNGAVTSYSYDVLLRLSHLRSVCADGTMQDIDYDYDEVSNISKIVNYAGMLPTGLGGTYGSQFSYDNLYRLAYADGNWQGNNSLYYETSLEYEKNGRISRKVLHADTWLDGNYATENYDNRYYYANSSQPNTLSYINDTPQQSFGWDQKGNMVFHHNAHSGYDRKLCWDEQNRLLCVKDEGKLLSYYLYDANGDRTYKFTGEYAAQNQSGQWHYYYLLNCPTLYASPYLVTNKKGYTKHYYAESERIASRIGGGGLQDLHKGFENYPDMVGKHKKSSAKLFYKVMECLDADALPQEDALKYLYEWLEFVEEEKDCYWYHPDHLGSSSWITYTDGTAVQHLHYLPWGEDFVDQRSTSWNAMYTFSAKEKDTETGYSYFGSRYYNSDLSIWLSVDPLSDKYPSMSPYVYCANNPVKLVDPNGEDWFENELTGDVYYSRYFSKDDVSRIEGEGWKWMGKDDMFGSSPTQLALVDHFNKATFVNSDREGVGTALFEGDNAKKFMSDLGYDFKPSILEVSISEYKQQADVDISGNPIYIYNQLTSEKALKSVYVPKNSTGSYSILNRTAYVDEFLGFHVMKTSWTETRQYTYSTSNFMKYGKVLKQLTPLMIDLYKECKTIQFQQMFHR